MVAVPEIPKMQEAKKMTSVFLEMDPEALGTSRIASS